MTFQRFSPSQDLVSLKGLESFSLMECEEIHGEENVTAGDDFTVQTSLEDLEFGFSIVRSTEKVRVYFFYLPDDQFLCMCL